MTQKLYKIFASPILATFLLLLFGTAMAVATFIENDFGTATAWKLIYDALWFELIMVGLSISFLLNIFKYKLHRKEKWSILLFHIAFIVIIVGAGITRYTSYGGVMRIREGASSNIIISDANYIKAKISDGNTTKVVLKKVSFSPLTDNDFNIKTDFNSTPIEISYHQFVADALPKIEDNVEAGTSLLEMVVTSGNGRETVFLQKGEIEQIGAHKHLVGFEAEGEGVINILEKDGVFKMHTPRELDFFIMASQTAGKIKKDTLMNMTLRTLYRDGDASFVPTAYHPKAKINIVSTSDKLKDNDPNKDDALLVDVTIDGETKTTNLLYRQGFLPTEHKAEFKDISVLLSYGAEAQETPFSIQLNDFQLERYPGSTSPSEYASEVTVVDGEVKTLYRIFMNNVLDYKGYRFFQASYDTDEQGTVLSVNHDAIGTWVTYLGYLLMGLGMFFTLFGKASRFREINKKLNKLKKNKTMLLLVLLLGGFVQASPIQEQEKRQEQIIDVDHAALFGRLMVQDLDGRIKPINTLASEFLRKISGRPYFKLTQNGATVTLDANQTFLAMHVSANYWEQVPIIKIDKQKLGSIYASLELGENGLISFQNLLGEGGEYLFSEDVEIANQKKPAERNEFDKEVLKVDERFNILYNVFIGNYLKVFPNSKDANNTWFTYTHHFNDFPEEDGRFAKAIIPTYFSDVAMQNWGEATEKLGYINTYQKILGKDIIPSDKRVAAELWYNDLNLNFWLFQVLFVLGFLLLVLAMVKVFIENKNIELLWNFLILLTLLSFVAFAGNIVLRWYVAQHAPWSNGYEMLIFVAWVLMLCGLLTYRKSDFALPLATLFSGALLFVSYLDWINPEITNLMPVLKSYWLKVHVATIVSSYAPLALSAILGLMALILMIIKTPKTKERLDLKIKELTYINESSMTIGLFVLAIGTFLGGIWANESWGRYWAWDPKETWALISIIVYAIVLHLRFIPALKSTYVLHVASMFAFWSIIMTSFGVNYYLSGLHSYAAGDPVPIPLFVYFVAGFMVVVAVLAYFSNRRKV
ncbi:cytochrome c biogenesis protein CcsA [uncultured Maribacter sp.]|uniref:cytochrome c biogenesis protein n=1 Tax=uncultured Maribacter sp. TaxID=431308 RepID=UPI0026062593|nr:cytochrome c biogenesis protein CcsA [uncultured Maribacter sp.]